jgi:hypothetical protein
MPSAKCERLDREIAAAKKSLATTERQLNSDGTLLRLALELADDVAAVHRMADPQPKRALNQAFYRRIKIVGRRDKESGRRVAHVLAAELSKSYAALMAKSFTPKVRSADAWLRARPGKQKAAPMGPPSFNRC